MSVDRFDPAWVADLQRELNDHRVYGLVDSLPRLRVFMAHHVFSVWDFMSVIKYLQGIVAPVRVPWVPVGDATVRYFINQLVLEEESDQGLPGADGEPGWASHFELYCTAMAEVSADPGPARRFVEQAGGEGIDAALASGIAPPAAAGFMTRTFGFIASDAPHRVAAAFALGREHIIPGMFRAFLARMGVDEGGAPAFHYYLRRHIHLDEDFHGPISLRLLDQLCAGDAGRLDEARQAAREALMARMDFWDGVARAMEAGS